MLYWHRLYPIRTICQFGNLAAANPSHTRITSVLRHCDARKTLLIAHHDVICNSQDHGPFLLNLVIGLYGRFGSLPETRAVFYSLQQRNVYSWTSIIDTHAQHGLPTESLRYFRSMLKEGLKPDRILCLCMLGVCSDLLDLETGKEVHSFLDDAALKADVVAKTALVNMYCKCGSLADAISIFNLSEEKDPVLFGAIMTCYNRHGLAEHTFEAFEQMLLEGLKPSEYAFVAVLGACGISLNIVRNKAVHSCLMHCGYESNVVLGTALINSYNKCGSLKDVVNVFQNIPHGDTVLWNTMIMIFTQHGQEKDALLLYQQMLKQGLKPSQVTYVCALCAVTELSFLPQGKTIHAQIIEYRVETNPYVVTALISMYTRCGSVKEAHEVFNRVYSRNVESWTALIAAYSYNGHVTESFQFYEQMLIEGASSDRCAFTTILSVCCCAEYLANGKQIHTRALSCGFMKDVELQTSLISMYGKCGSVADAVKVFDTADLQNIGLWNSMMAAYMQLGNATKAMQLYHIMQKKGIQADTVTFATILSACSVLTDLPEGKKIHECIKTGGLQSDVVLGTALVNMYAKCGNLSEAHKVFDQLQGRNDISWNALIVGYAQNGRAKEAVALFKKMCSEGFIANEVTCTNLLYACSHAGLVEEALRFFKMMEDECKITPTSEHYACIIDLLGRVGRLDDAEGFAKRSPYKADCIMWMSLLGACKVHGDIDIGRRVAEKVFKLDPERAEPYVLMSNISVTQGTVLRNFTAVDNDG